MWSYMHYIKGEEYLRKFVAQKLFIHPRPAPVGGESCAWQDRCHVGIGYSSSTPFIKANLPVAPLPVPKEGVYVSGGYGHLTILKNPPPSQCHQSFRQLAASAATAKKCSAAGMGGCSRRLRRYPVA